MNPNGEVTAWRALSGDDICICGIGARTAVGLTAGASAAAVRASISGLGIHPFFVDQDDEPVSFAADPAIEADLPIAKRMLYMLQSVSEEVQGQIPSTVKIDRVWLALPEPRSGLPAVLDTGLAAQIVSTGLTREPVHTLSRGHAGGLMRLAGRRRGAFARGRLKPL